MINGIFFLDNYSRYVTTRTFVGVLNQSLGSKEELISDYWNKFNCPQGSYSWDSLDEILSDFSWIDAERIVIVHQDIPNLDDKDLKVYLSILSESSFLDSATNKEINNLFDGILVVFPESCKERIQSILSN